MAFTYDVSTNRGKVRFLLQDTTNTTTRPALLQDAEVDFALATEHNIYMAAALCADALAGRFRGLKSKSVGGLSLTWVAETWEAVASKWRARGGTHQIISAGGVYESDRDAIWEDSDLLRPGFFSQLHEFVGQLPAARASSMTEEELP